MDTIFENGLTYYKLVSNYSGDTTKNCGLIGSEIDNNFYTLRGHDIESVAFSGNTLILRRLNGSEIHVNIDQTPEITDDNLTFRYDKNSGNLTIVYPNGETSEISGFTNNALTEIYTNSTLDGNGTINNPLGVSVTETTGAYSPAKEYVELNPGEELSSENAKPGDRIVTKEIIDNFGRIYSPDGVEIISDYLDSNNSDWRIPSKYDWDLLLDSLEDEHAEEGYMPHSAETIGLLGEDAAQPLKSDFLWEFNDSPITEDGTCGFDVVGFNIIPVGGDYDGDKISEEFNKKSTMWTSTITEDGYYTKEFMYDTNKVGQNIADKGFFSIRLVKDFDGNNYKGVETIFGQSYPTTLIPETNQIWTSINVYATKKQIIDLSKGENFIEINKEIADLENVQTGFYINEWDGNEWVKKELKEGDSIVITQRDIDEDITAYYRKWTVKDGELVSFEDYVNTEFEFMTKTFNATIEEMRSTFNHKISALTETFEYQISELTNDFSQSIQTLSGELSTQIVHIDERLETFINDELENTIKSTIKNYIQGTPNEIKITETDDDKLKIGLDNMPHDNHEYVDLGLPSGTLWATENIKDGNGNELYFAWGETKGYTSGQVGTDKYFAWEGDHADYKYGTLDFVAEPDYGITKYNSTDGKTVLDAEDDAATVNWGSDWKMPTKEQFDELTANTTTAWTQVDGVNGLLCTSTANTNTLFFPAVGSAADGGVSVVGDYGDYWSVSLGDRDVSNAWRLYFRGRYCEVLNGYRFYGYSVRPVRSNN